jgi:hypothetical protein
MHERIFDRSNYSKKTLDTFEIITAYFVDIFYNHLFLEAKKLRTNKSVDSITEGYKHALNAFLQGIENPKLYKKTLVGIHSFFISSGFNSITFAECIERITTEFIPKNYYSTVSNQQKISILKLVICQSNKAFVENLVKKFLSMVIDNHNEPDNIRVLQDKFIDILMIERENLFNRFVSTQKNVKSNPHNALTEAMQTEIKKLCKEKFELKKLTTDMKKIILKKEHELQASLAQLNRYKAITAELQNQLAQAAQRFEAREDIALQSEKPMAVVPIMATQSVMDTRSSTPVDTSEYYDQPAESDTPVETVEKSVMERLADAANEISSNRSHSSQGSRGSQGSNSEPNPIAPQLQQWEIDY